MLTQFQSHHLIHPKKAFAQKLTERGEFKTLYSLLLAVLSSFKSVVDRILLCLNVCPRKKLKSTIYRETIHKKIKYININVTLNTSINIQYITHYRREYIRGKNELNNKNTGHL